METKLFRPSRPASDEEGISDKKTYHVKDFSTQERPKREPLVFTGQIFGQKQGNSPRTIIAARIQKDTNGGNMKTRSKKANFLAYVFLLLTALAGTASADVVSDWNVIGLGEAVAAGRQGGAPAIDLATMHAAMYDAVQAIEKDYEPYRVTDVPNATGSPVAAAAKAARDVLVARFPLRAGAINTLYVNYLNDHFIDPSDPGIAVGAYVATKLLAYRACDGSLPIPAPTFIGGMGIGEWRPTPLMAFAAMNPGPYLGQVTPFFMTRPTQFRPDPPPAVTSKQYARDYEEVKLYGAKTGSLRSPEQTDQAFFWAGNTFAAIYSGVRNAAANNVDNVSD